MNTSSTKPTYIFTSIVPDMIQENINTLRDKIGILPYRGGNDPDDIITINTGHITMKRAFYLRNTINEEVLLSSLSNITYKSIRIKISRIDIFDSPELGNVLVGVVEKNDELKQLHMNIYTLLGDTIEEKYSQYQKENFTPHVSLIYNLPDVYKHEAIEEAEKMLPMQYMLTSVQLLRSKSEADRTRNLVKEFYAIN